MNKTDRIKIFLLLAGGLVAVILLIIASIIARKERNNDAPAESQNQTLKVEEIATSLDTPWDIEFLPDNRMIFTERRGHAFLLSNGQRVDLGMINDTTERGEGGLLGVAVDPDFEINNYIYFYHTYTRENNFLNRVVRYTLNDSQLISEIQLINSIPAADNHNGGGLSFGPDGKLYVCTGDASQPSLAQDTNSVAGKILRINKDGSIPEDNPFGNAVWAYGLRNPQGLAWHPTSGTLFATEHGPSAMDEINIIEKGRNYGWPIYECSTKKGDQQLENTTPIACFVDFTLAPSGLAILNNSIYVGGLRGQQLRRLDLNIDSRTIKNQDIVFDNYGRIRAVTVYDGRLYFGTSNRDGRGNIRSDDDRIVGYRP